MVGYTKNNQAITSEMCYEARSDLFERFLEENMDFIEAFLPENPSISPDDEWRTDDYSFYDEKNNVNGV